MATLLKPPKSIFEQKGVCASVFLAGSIEMGKAEKWQDKVWKGLKDIPGLGVLNPRRDDWNDSWKQEITNLQFRTQVEWELDGLENADIVAFYFDPKTQSPISLLELGLLSHRFSNFKPEVVVCCEEPFWRKGNVDIVAKRYGHKQVSSIEELVKTLQEKFDYLNNLGKDFDVENCKIGWNNGK